MSAPGTVSAQMWPRKHVLQMADRCNISVTQFSEGKEVLLLIHGFGENGYSWGEIPPGVASAYSAFAVDLRGHGDSQWDAHAEYHLGKFVSDLITVVDVLGLSSFSIAGHSLGANVALCIASRLRQRVRKLILVEFSLDSPAADVLAFHLAQFEAQFRVYASLVEYNSFLQQQRPLADSAALLRYSNYSVRLTPGVGYEVKCDPQLRRLHQTRDGRTEHSRMQLAALSCPLLLVRGSGSAIMPQAAAREILHLVPRAQLASVPGAGHAVMLDRPNELYRIVSRFLLSDNSGQAMP